MNWKLLIIGFLVLVIFISGCVKDVETPINRTNSSYNHFGIYLNETGELVISDQHIISYNKTNHRIMLSEEGVNRMKSYFTYHIVCDNDELGYLGNGTFGNNRTAECINPKKVKKTGKLYQKEFVIKLNDDEIYSGAFWSMFSSRIYLGVTITDVSIINDEWNYLMINAPLNISGQSLVFDPRANDEILLFFNSQTKG